MGQAIIRVAADGSPGSRRAFEWALEEAELRGCGVELVTAYQIRDHRSADAARAHAEKVLHATMDDIVVGNVQSSATVSWHVVSGDPADVLVRDSAHSQMLVLGSHGVTGMIHTALGSVADACARLAECPVVIIPPENKRVPSGELVGAARPGSDPGNREEPS